MNSQHRRISDLYTVQHLAGAVFRIRDAENYSRAEIANALIWYGYDWGCCEKKSVQISTGASLCDCSTVVVDERIEAQRIVLDDVQECSRPR